jgi:thiamine biosynthesis protein ThiS
MKVEAGTISANGKQEQIDLPCSVGEFLASRGWKTTQVVVECNGRVLGRDELSDVMLRNGDRLEVIVPVAGG